MTAIFETRGTAPRLYRNTLIFLAADGTRLKDLDEAVRKFLAWESILDEREKLYLSPHQVKQAETQQTAADGAVTGRLPETYQWLINRPKKELSTKNLAWVDFASQNLVSVTGDHAGRQLFDFWPHCL